MTAGSISDEGSMPYPLSVEDAEAALLEAAKDEHFYGAWKGGSAKSGGHPAASGGGGGRLSDAAEKSAERISGLPAVKASQNWPETKPWEATGADIKAGKVPGLGVSKGGMASSGGEVLGYADFAMSGNILINTDRWDETGQQKRAHLLYHELGHFATAPALRDEARRNALMALNPHGESNPSERLAWMFAQAATSHPARDMVAGKLVPVAGDVRIAKEMAREARRTGVPAGVQVQLFGKGATLTEAALLEAASKDHFYGAWVGGSRAAGGGPVEGEPFGDASQKAAWLSANQERYENDPEFAAACDAISSYTTGDYESLRDISAGGDGWGPYPHLKRPDGTFRDADMKPDSITKAQMGALFNRGDGKGFTGRAFKGQIDPNDPTRTTSKFTNEQGAMALNRMVDRAPRSQTPIYRGLGEHFGYSDDSKRPIPKVGDTFEVKGATSFTRSETADTFARKRNVGGKGSQPDREWLIEAHNAKAINVDALSPWNQQEAISRGTFRVKDVQVNRTVLKYVDANGRTVYGSGDKPGITPVYATHAYRRNYYGRSSDDYPAERVRVILEGVDA